MNTNRLDRLAYQNMTSKGKSPFSGKMDENGQEVQPQVPFTNELNRQAYYANQSQNQNQNPNPNQYQYQNANPNTMQNQASSYFDYKNNMGGASLDQLNGKSKMNTQINHYQLERLAKNEPQYNNFVNAFNSNITEDQKRTYVNNDQLKTEQRGGDNLQRVYHPGLASDVKEDIISTQITQRSSMGTRDKASNAVALAKNKNTPHSATMTAINSDLPKPQPKLNYPDGYDRLTPIGVMDMTSHIEMQFQTLTDQDMDTQITNLQSSAAKQDMHIVHGQTPLDRQTYFHAQQQNLTYNPHADYMNQQMTQMSKQMPDGRNTLNTQIQSMNAMHALSNIPNVPAVDPLGFQRPTPSNFRSAGNMSNMGNTGNVVGQGNQGGLTRY